MLFSVVKSSPKGSFFSMDILTFTSAFNLNFFDRFGRLHFFYKHFINEENSYQRIQRTVNFKQAFGVFN